MESILPSTVSMPFEMTETEMPSASMRSASSAAMEMAVSFNASVTALPMPVQSSRTVTFWDSVESC